MSKANNPIKVLRTALKRVNEGWTKSHWHIFDRKTKKNYVCLEGAIYGYCDSQKHKPTLAQQQAVNVVKQIISERHGMDNIPEFNDFSETTLEDIQEVIKLGIIRLETGGDGLNDEEFDELLEFKDKEKSS